MPQRDVLHSLLYEPSRAIPPLDRAFSVKSAARRNGLGIERSALPGVIDPRVKIAAKRNRDTRRVIATDRLGEA